MPIQGVAKVSLPHQAFVPVVQSCTPIWLPLGLLLRAEKEKGMDCQGRSQCSGTSFYPVEECVICSSGQRKLRQMSENVLSGRLRQEIGDDISKKNP